MAKCEVHVVRNGYSGAERKSELYEQSKVREIVHKAAEANR